MLLSMAKNILLVNHLYMYLCLPDMLLVYGVPDIVLVYSLPDTLLVHGLPDILRL